MLSAFLVINTHAAAQPEPVFKGSGIAEMPTVKGPTADIMEPIASRDGKTLFLNNSNPPGVNTDLFSAYIDLYRATRK